MTDDPVKVCSEMRRMQSAIIVISPGFFSILLWINVLSCLSHLLNLKNELISVLSKEPLATQNISLWFE